MEKRYWKVIVKYDHVGKRNEVSVPRFIQTEADVSIIDAYKIVEEMPGVKNRGVHKIEEINVQSYLSGKCHEAENFYLQRLMNFNKQILHKNRKGCATS